MPEEILVRPAAHGDIEAIVAVLRANQTDPSLFQRSAADIQALLADYYVAERASVILGCAGLHFYPDHSAELHSVAVLPAMQGQHVGYALVQACMNYAASANLRKVWLGTLKPAYFARFGFVPFSRWKIPLRFMIPKIKSVFAQPPDRWLPAFLGSYTFMVLPLVQESSQADMSKLVVCV
jgi:N-acetylglutamate synthase-like GNAT family acetyltransferase